MKKLVAAIGALAIVCLCGSCGADRPQSRPETSTPTRTDSGNTLPLGRVDPVNSGVIRGKVKFSGAKPEMPTIDFSSNPQCERQHLKKGEKAETVVVNGNGTLRNTLVWIKAGLPKARWEPPAAIVTLDQAGCVYRPHVLALMVNQELEVLNSDPVNHNVHIEASINAASNNSEPPRAETIRKKFTAEEIWFPVTCSVHPWMKSYIAVIGHPFFAVTGADGSFEIKGVPAGEYTLDALHETFGRKSQTVRLAPNQNLVADFIYVE